MICCTWNFGALSPLSTLSRSFLLLSTTPWFQDRVNRVGVDFQYDVRVNRVIDDAGRRIDGSKLVIPCPCRGTMTNDI